MSGDTSRFSVDPALGALAVGQVISWGVLYYSPLVALSAIARVEGWSLVSLTAVLSIGLLVAAVVGIPVGRLLDTLPPRRILVAGATLGVSGTVALSASTELVWFALSMVVIGLGQSALLYQAAFTVATHRYRRSLDFSLTVITIAGGLSSAIFAPAVIWLVSEIGWRATFLVLATVMAVLIPIFAVWLPGDRPCPDSAESADSPDQLGVSDTVRSGRFVRLGIVLLVTTVAIFSVTFLAIPLSEEKGLDQAQAAWLFAAIGFGQVFGRVGFLFLRLERAPRLLLASVSLGSGLSILGFVAAGNAWVALVGIALLIGALRGAHTLVQATAVSLRWGRVHYGALNGVLAAPLSVALALAPAIGGQLAEALSSFSSMAVVMALALIVIAPLSRYT